MNARLLELAEKRATLIARAESQRADLAQAVRPVESMLAIVDRGITGTRYLGQHPALLTGLIAVIALLRPGFVFRWFRRGWLMWRFSRLVKEKLASL